jgi:hypothetical protein
MSEHFQWIPVNLIDKLMDIEITDVYLTRQNQVAESLQLYDKLLVVEQKGNRFVLVGGYDRYEFLKQAGEEYAPCIIEDSSSIVDQHYKLLRRTFPKGDTRNDNKVKIMHAMKVLGEKFEIILKRIGYRKSDFKGAKLVDEKPVKIQKQQQQQKKQVENWIKNSNHPESIKKYLLEVRKNTNYLTSSKMVYIENTLKKVNFNFNQLNDKNKIKVIQRLIYFQADSSAAINKIILDLLKRQKTNKQQNALRA